MAEAIRILVGAAGALGIFVAIFGKDDFRWGRGGKGPRIEPQWVGRIFFALIGSFLLYGAIFKLWN